MEEENKEKEENIYYKLCEEVEKSIRNLLENEGVTRENAEILGELVDIYKDLENVKYWERKENNYMYGNYGNYGNYGSYGNYGRRGNYGRGGSYGEYGEGSYGRRGYDAKYRGYEQIEKMGDSYGRYEEGREQYNRGNYGAKEDTLKSLEFMLQSAEDFLKMLKSEANSQEEMQIFQEYAQRFAQM